MRHPTIRAHTLHVDTKNSNIKTTNIVPQPCFVMLRADGTDELILLAEGADGLTFVTCVLEKSEYDFMRVGAYFSTTRNASSVRRSRTS